MITMYKWQKVKAMNAQGIGIKKIARTLKISKNTVRKYLRSNLPPEFHPRDYTRIIDPYVDDIKEMIQKGYIGTRIHEELTAMGFNGSLSTVHRLIRGIKEDIKRSEKITTRYETPPGYQMQYDWKEWQLNVDGKPLRIYIHEAILSYSRKKYYTFSLTIEACDIIRAIHQSLIFFGGVPKEIIIDNSRQMVITHEKDGIVRYNDNFLKFLGIMGITPDACIPYRARTKGKIERPFYHIQEHLLKGCEVGDLQEFDRRLSAYTDSINKTIHTTIKETPDDRFQKEKDALMPLPEVDYALIYPRQIRQVTSDGYISYNGVMYPVPMRLALKKVPVENVLGRYIYIYDEKGLPHKQSIRTEKGITIPHPEHEMINKAYMDKKEANKSVLVDTFKRLFPEHIPYLEGLRKTHGPNLYFHLKEIISLTHIYSVCEISRVIGQCSAMGAYHKNTIRRLINTSLVKEPAATCDIPHLPSMTRDLSVYREVMING